MGWTVFFQKNNLARDLNVVSAYGEETPRFIVMRLG